jgi:hypothetical protein
MKKTPVIRNLHGGKAERRAGGSGTFRDTKSLIRSRDDDPLVEAAISARQRRRRAVWFPN